MLALLAATRCCSFSGQGPLALWLLLGSSLVFLSFVGCLVCLLLLPFAPPCQGLQIEGRVRSWLLAAASTVPMLVQ